MDLVKALGTIKFSYATCGCFGELKQEHIMH
jgi:hypothetical protein